MRLSSFFQARYTTDAHWASFAAAKNENHGPERNGGSWSKGRATGNEQGVKMMQDKEYLFMKDRLMVAYAAKGTIVMLWATR